MPALPRLILLLSLILTLAACEPERAPAGKPRLPKAHLVQTATAQVRPIRYTVERTCTLEASRRVRIFNQEEGRIVEIPFHPGDAVRAGALLVRLDDALLKAQLDKAEATLRQAREDLKRLDKLVRKRLASDEERQQAATAVRVAEAEAALLRTRLTYMQIRAPFAGVVSERLMEPGDIAPRHSHILTLIDPDSLVVRIALSERYLSDLSVGMPVSVRIDAMGPRAWTGRLTRIYPTVDPDTHLARVEAVLTPQPPGARPGEFCRARIVTPPRERLVIPFRAVRRDTEGSYVFRVRAGKARRARVRTGLRQNGAVEILEGLAAGDQVVVRGLLGLKDGMAVRQAGTDKGAPAGHE